MIHHDQLKSCDDSDVPKWVERMQECIINGSDVDPFVCTQFMDSSGLFEPSHPSEDMALPWRMVMLQSWTKRTVSQFGL